MIEFQTITVQNFLSVGNVPITLPLNTDHITTVTGPSGSGKSLLITDALVFSIFGRPFRNINKPQLINSINQKNCLVTLLLNVNHCNYKIVRGIKPNIFEIYQNGVLLNQEADSRDYQKILEQQILKLNYKTFTQVVILGSAGYIPFMQLTSAQRREVVENILDISIFSTMGQLLKNQMIIAKETLNKYENNLTITKNKISSQKKLIEILIQSKQSRLDDINIKIKINDTSIENNKQLLNQYKDEIKNLQSGLDQHIHQCISDTKANITQYKNKIEDLQKQLDFFNTNSICSVCSQPINDDHKHNMDSTIKDNINYFTNELKVSQTKLEYYNKVFLKNKDDSDKIRDLGIKCASIEQVIVLLHNDNVQLYDNLNQIQQDRTDIGVEKALLKTLAVEAMQIVNDKTAVLEQIQLYTVATQLLKDDGIKTAIIKEYLPSINKLINHYLNVLDFYVKFELDTTLNETVKSRGRDIFSYHSFSDGEKSRLSIALMLTWRTIAKTKGAVYTNLLILDEIFSQHLDPLSVQAVKDLLVTDLVDNNIFVITHTHVDDFKAISSRVIETKKVGDFTTVVLD